jgi:hypothetical protein
LRSAADSWTANSRRRPAVSGVLADLRPRIGPWYRSLMSHPLLRGVRRAPAQDSQVVVPPERALTQACRPSAVLDRQVSLRECLGAQQFETLWVDPMNSG